MRISGSRIVVAGTALLVLVAGLLVGWAALRAPSDRTTPARPPAPASPAAAPPAPAESAAPATTGAPAPGASRAVAALGVLRAWDRARAAAWARGDPRALAALYVPGARAGVADVAMLRRWHARGLRVRGMSMQVLAAEVRVRAPDRLVLVVTDRLAGAVAVPGGLPLPRDQPTTRRLDLRRVGGRWLLAASVELSPG